MSFDALTLAAVRDELEPLLTGARMQKLIFVDELSLQAECFQPAAGRINVLLSAHLEHGRVQRMRQLAARGVEGDTPFSLLVRKHLRNARIRAIRQPRLERVLELECEQRDSSERLNRVLLIVEAMGRRSNLVLVDEAGRIFDAARRTPPSRSRRPILPHLPYAPPPPQDRVWPEALSVASLRPEAGVPVDKLLGQRVAGLSPLAAREIAYRAGESADWQRVVDVARDLLGLVDTHAWSPTVAFDADGPLAYAPYALTHLSSRARLQPYATMSDALEAFYARTRSVRRGDALAAERKALLAPLERAQHTAVRRTAALEHQLTTGQTEREPLRQAGEAILTHQAELPEGATELNLDGQSIVLDPQLTAVENAQAYFARYRKAREAEERVPVLLEEARLTAEHLANLRTLVEVANQMDAVRALRREVAAATDGPSRADGRRTSKASPYQRVALADGWEALIGTSATGNATVTFEVARNDDLWLHARGVAGAHVVLRGGIEPPDDVLERAAQLAAAHSAARESSTVDVDVAPRRYVKKVPGGPPGLVRYANERTLRVTPRS